MEQWVFQNTVEFPPQPHVTSKLQTHVLGFPIHFVMSVPTPSYTYYVRQFSFPGSDVSGRTAELWKFPTTNLSFGQSPEAGE